MKPRRGGLPYKPVNLAVKMVAFLAELAALTVPLTELGNGFR